MKTIVNMFRCIGCGKCIMRQPDIYAWNSYGKAQSKVAEIPLRHVTACRLTASLCPEKAILVNKEQIDFKSFLVLKIRETNFLCA